MLAHILDTQFREDKKNSSHLHPYTKQEKARKPKRKSSSPKFSNTQKSQTEPHHQQLASENHQLEHTDRRELSQDAKVAAQDASRG